MAGGLCFAFALINALVGQYGYSLLLASLGVLSWLLPSYFGKAEVSK
jgi:hypothetical protein